MAHDINWFRKQHKAWMTERQGLIDAAETAHRRVEAAVAAERAAQEEQRAAEIAARDRAAADLGAELAARDSYITSQRATIRHLEDISGKLESQVMTARSERDEWMNRCEQAAPTIELLEGQINDLKSLLDKVRSSMTKKQLEQESAILNRQVLAGAIPGRRFR